MVDPNANTPPYDRALCAALAAAGCDVELLTSRFLYERIDAPSTFRVTESYFRLAGSRLANRLGLTTRPPARQALKAAEYPVDWIASVLRLLRRRPDVVHVQWSVQPALDQMLWRAFRSAGLPLVYTAHNLVPHRAEAADMDRYGRLYRAADAVIVHSDRSKVVLRDEWGVPADNLVVAPHGLLHESVPPTDRHEARRQLGLPVDAKLVLFTGLIEPYKGLTDLIAAFTSVASEHPDAYLVIAGKPNEPFGRYQRQLSDLRLTSRTAVELEFLPENRLAAYLCAADVVVLPYRETTSSGLLFVARRFGRPVVATHVGDLAEVIVDGESGLLVPPANPDRLGAAISRLLADPELAQRLGFSGYEVSAGPQGWGEAARRTVALYERLLARG